MFGYRYLLFIYVFNLVKNPLYLSTNKQYNISLFDGIKAYIVIKYLHIHVYLS